MPFQCDQWGVNAESTASLPTRRATRHLGAALARALQAGDLVVLEGDLGAGKTFLVRAIARGLGVPSRLPVTSPTFTLVNEHRTRIPLVHADLYRLGDADELVELGLMDRIGRDAIVLVEWGDRFREALGDEGLWIWLSLSGETTSGRSARLLPRGKRGMALFERLRALVPELVKQGG
jgi:tRNA threonylcarbamoyladenosine biosynthesis protein TsaE